MINVINPVVRDFHIVLQREREINFVSSRVALNGTHVKNLTVGVHAVLKSFLIASFLFASSTSSLHSNFLHSTAPSSSRG